MDNYNQLFQSIFKKEMGAIDTLKMLDDTKASYPFFTPAQFFALYLSDKESPAYAAQAKKTGLLFNNNHWLNYLLLAAGENTEGPRPQHFSGNTETTGVTQYENNEPIGNMQDAPAAENETEAAAPLQESLLIIEEIEIIPEATHQQLQEAIELPTSINNVDEREQIEKLTPADTLANANIVPVEDLIPGETVTQEVGAVVENFDPSTNETEAATIKTVPVETVTITEEQQPAFENAMLPNETVATNNIENEAPLHIPFNISKEPVTEDSITFEPLHTSDYFASVGIKLSEEARPVDRLGQQMKSFTEWLKTMKKMHAAQFAETGSAPQSAAQTNEQHIQQLAEASNKEGEVVTEAMADVLVQQGRVGKALEVLEKLSLLNPGKITYFAAKINQLKEL